MKKIFKISCAAMSAAMIMSAAFGLTACKHNDDNGGNGGGSGTKLTMPMYSIAILK